MTRLLVLMTLFGLALGGCPAATDTRAAATKDMDKAKTGAGEMEGEATGAAETGTDWKEKILVGTAAATDCDKDQVQIDDWSQVTEGAFGAKCNDAAYRCTKEEPIKCEPEAAE